MSEFDPEKVEPFDYDDIHGYSKCPQGEFVSAAEYYQLLALYRLQKTNLESAMATIEAIDRECLIGCRSLPSIQETTDSLISLVPGRHAKS